MDNVSAPDDNRRFAPATARNRDVVKAEVSAHLAGKSGILLEIGSGSGEHAAFIAPDLHGFQWQPSDVSTENIESVEAWRRHTNHDGFLEPLHLDVMADDWTNALKDRPISAIFSANVIHITPSTLWPRLIDGASELLKAGGLLMLYGPFRRHGKQTSESNENFELWLKEKDTDFGVRDWEEIAGYASDKGLKPYEPKPMPANNFFMALKKA